MEFRVIFLPYNEFETVLSYNGFAAFENFRSLLSASAYERKRILPEGSNIGIHILDLYRKETKDQDVGIDDIPDIIEENWRDNKYIVVKINEDTARASGKFLDSDTFYCKVDSDLMRTFDALDILGRDTDNPKLKIIVDEPKILEEWANQGYPEQLCSPKSQSEEVVE